MCVCYIEGKIKSSESDFAETLMQSGYFWVTPSSNSYIWQASATEAKMKIFVHSQHLSYSFKTKADWGWNCHWEGKQLLTDLSANLSAQAFCKTCGSPILLL